MAKLNEVFQIDLRINHGGFSVLPQDEKTFRNIRIYFESLNGFQLAAAERVIHDMKSVMLGLAYMRNLISVEDVIKAAHLELFFQSQKWGLVEDVHEVELARLRQNLYLAKIIV